MCVREVLDFTYIVLHDIFLKTRIMFKAYPFVSKWDHFAMTTSS
jgi:hypothetical protein